MHIFSIYKQNESSDQFEALKKIIFSINEKKILIEEAINDFLKLAFMRIESPYSRSLACAMALNLKVGNVNQLIEEKYVEFCKILERDCLLCYEDGGKKLYPSVFREFQGISEQYGYYFNLPDIDKLLPENQDLKPILYRPGKSGFFSVIENIINAQIYASIKGRKIIIDLDGDWWVYKQEFQDIFDCFEYKKPGIHNFFYGNLKQGVARDWFFGLSPIFWDDYDLKKSEIYKKIHRSLYEFICSADPSCAADVNLRSDLAVYVRRGDKIGLEDVCIPDKQVIKSINNLLNLKHDVYLSSDDSLWLKKNFSHISNVSFDEKESEGYYFGKESDIDHLEIIKKYLRMVNANMFTADVGSNLINAIAYTRIAMGLPGIEGNKFFPAKQIPLI
jgi:hypothetical protein